jgi:hypothetical protein
VAFVRLLTYGQEFVNQTALLFIGQCLDLVSCRFPGRPFNLWVISFVEQNAAAVAVACVVGIPAPTLAAEH